MTTHEASDRKPHIPPAYLDHLLSWIQDYAVCSDLRMYAWAIRRQREKRGDSPQRRAYAREVEVSMAGHAEDAFEELKDFVARLAAGELPELPAAEPLKMEGTLAEMLETWDAAILELDLPDSELATTAAAGIVVSKWRDTLEPWHYFFSDAEMSWMSVVATRDIAEHMNVAANAPDLASITRILTDGHREVLPGLSAGDALGPAWPEIRRRITERLEEEAAIGTSVRALAGWACHVSSRWWGCPRWRRVAKDGARALGLTRYRERQLITEPWKLSFEVWEQFIDHRERAMFEDRD